MTPPPSATANYDAGYQYAPEDIHAMMAEVTAQQGNSFWRAVRALFMTALGCIILLCVLAYNPFDPTGDTAGIGVGRHPLGAGGANVANIIMQTLGWGGLMGGGLIVLSGIRRLMGRVGYRTRLMKWKRFGIGAGAVLLGTMTLSAFPIPQSWPMASGLGGWIGDLLHLTPKGWLDAFNVPLSGLWIAILSFASAAYLLALYLGVVTKDLLDIADAATLVWAYIRVWFDRLSAWLVRIFRRGYEDPMDAQMQSEPIYRDIPDTPLPIAEPIAEPVTYAPEPMVAPIAAPAPKTRKTPAKRKAAQKSNGQVNFDFSNSDEFVLPGLDLLKAPPPRSNNHDQGALRRASEQLHKVMGDYGVDGEMGGVSPGPVVTLFEFEPAPGVKSQRIINLSDDIARNMSAQSARIAVVPGRNAMGVELPNRKREMVWLQNMLASDAFTQSGAALPLILGEDIGGTPFIADLAKMPHLLVAGTTGSGKSVGVNAMILSLMYTLTPEQCKFIMIDPKMLELSVYDGCPHLLAPVVTEPKKAVVALKWTVREMEDRYRKMAKMNVRNMAGFNEKVAEFKASGEVMTKTIMTGYNKESGEPEYETEELSFEPMPYIVVIIDEMADLMMVAKKDIEGSVQRLAQMARAAGIHVIMATQRPSTDVITGTIKANFPARICFRVGSKIDSRVILGEQGGEALLGNGDMLFSATGRPRRLHGPFVSDGEVERIANFMKAQGAPSYLDDITTEREEGPSDAKLAGGGSEGGSLFDQAVAIVARDRKASTSYVQRKLSIGYNRAADLVERMETEGMIGPSGAGGKREIFLPEEEAF
ncbi:DNA translocase FtsK [Litorimonas cladophorae]|uniref:DNA translocase FtsK n=1 Tax=Litorimonas cladophorae TaxID=1220491 RepID=A0A918KVK8_9PROT|nr:DNA translocase FtsK [Litorimonas cladophorae]